MDRAHHNERTLMQQQRHGVMDVDRKMKRHQLTNTNQPAFYLPRKNTPERSIGNDIAQRNDNDRMIMIPCRV